MTSECAKELPVVAWLCKGSGITQSLGHILMLPLASGMILYIVYIVYIVIFEPGMMTPTY